MKTSAKYFPKNKTQSFFCKNLSLVFMMLLIFVSSLKSNQQIHPSYEIPLRLNRISGFVYDQNRNPIERVFVELQDELNRQIGRTRTSSDGRYVFTGMSEGNFFVRIIPVGTNFEEQTIRVQVVNLGPPGGGFGNSDDVTQDFYLRTKRQTKNKSKYEPGVLFAQEIPEKAKLAYKNALTQINNKNYSEGVKFLQKALDIFPKYFIALNRLGYAHFEQKDYEKASEYFARAADVNPKSEPTLYLLAYSVYLTRRYDATITILQGALSHKHKTSRIYLLFGKCFRKKKNFIDAEKSLQIAEKLNTSKAPEVHWEMARLYGNDLKKYGKAAEQLELFLKLQPDSKDKKQIKKLIKKFRDKEKANN